MTAISYNFLLLSYSAFAYKLSAIPHSNPCAPKYHTPHYQSLFAAAYGGFGWRRLALPYHYQGTAPHGRAGGTAPAA